MRATPNSKLGPFAALTPEQSAAIGPGDRVVEVRHSPRFIAETLAGAAGVEP
jgi:hypothetical protein